MAKYSMHAKVREGFMCANALLNYAHELANDARDFGWVEAATLARKMEETAKSYLTVFQG